MRKLNVVLAPGSPVHRAVAPPNPAPSGAAPGASLAPGFEPQPSWNLTYWGGRTIADLVFVNRYVGGAKAWAKKDTEEIDGALNAAMSDAALQSVIAQYFNGPITSTMLASAVSDAAVPATVYKDTAEALATKLYEEGALGAADPANSVINIMLPKGVVLADDFSPKHHPPAGGEEAFKRRREGTIKLDGKDAASSKKGLGGYHGSVHLKAGLTIYYAVGVYSEKGNGIPAFKEPWKSVVATFYHELNEARTDPDVEDANTNNDNNLLGWYSQAGAGEIGDLPINESIEGGKGLSPVFQEVPLADGSGGKVPIQLMWSNAVGGPALSTPLAHWSSKPIGAQGRLFADPQPGPDETSFHVDNTSAEYYESPYYKLHRKQIQPIPAPSTSPPRMNLVDVIGAQAAEAIVKAGKIAFHAVGDTGAAKVNIHQGPAKAIEHQGWVADAMARDVQQGGPDAPSFFFHLGDVIYNFGEAEYYYDQFYEPYRAYDAPIFAIPGNHDGGVRYGEDPTKPLTPTLMAFLRNFCTTTPEASPDAGGLVRSTMTQPGVYFALDAPYVSIIGLYTNVLEGPGVISSEGGSYPIGDEQLQFLIGELERLKQLSDYKEGKRAVIIACHHPPTSVDSEHGGTLGLAEDIKAACTQAGMWPHAVLSGHAHLYQRFTRASEGRKTPYVVAGSGGFSATPPRESTPVTMGEFTLEIKPIVEFGYLTVTVDTNLKTPTLTIAFRSSDGKETHDEVTVNL